MNILIIGSTGMLGSSVGKYFEQQTGYDIYMTHRNKNVAYGKNQIQFDCLEDELDSISHTGFNSPCLKFDYILNCLGTIKPFMIIPISFQYLYRKETPVTLQRSSAMAKMMITGFMLNV